MDSDLVDFIAFVALGGGILAIIVNLIIATAVFSDGRRINLSGGLFMVGPSIWALLVFLTGVAGLALYWLCHYSTITASKSEIR